MGARRQLSRPERGESGTELQAVDLFAGCGGLTLGLRRAGFQMAVAVELDKAAARTYRFSNRRTHLIVDDVRRVRATRIRGHLQSGPVDLLAGCAPCQGFCSLTRKHHRSDPRNELLLEMARLIVGLRPRAVMMENVPGLLTRGSRVFRDFLERLEAAGYEPSFKILQMADYGVPQYRRRLVLVAGRGFQIPLPVPTRARAPRPASDVKPWATVRSAIGHLSAPVTMSAARRRSQLRSHNWHVARDLNPQTKARLRAARPGETWLDIDEAIRPTCHRAGYSGFSNTYGRMRWDGVSPTITGGCTTPCMGRFGHPDRRRYALSVREAALLQTFPEHYYIATNHMSRACDLIGNAVPPLFAEVVGRQIRSALRAHGK
ncbi:MAG: DNA cytosine methyltransferase [Candidatus Aenigmarchaeota archaeon]|nr:DNA cytosine methyltransferase [Candidatus Aenigmarchaeota archaeon]